MPYFTDTAARAIIRTTYEAAGCDDGAVAAALYDPAELTDLPDDAVLRAFGSSTRTAMPVFGPATSCSMWAVARGSTRCLRPGGSAPAAASLPST